MKSYQIITAEQFLSMLVDQWRFTGTEYLRLYDIMDDEGMNSCQIAGKNEAEPIEHILIVPTCFDEAEGYNSPPMEDILGQIQKINGESSILLIGSCCPIVYKKIERLRFKVLPRKIIIPAHNPYDGSCDTLSLHEQPLETMAKEIAERLESMELMRQETSSGK